MPFPDTLWLARHGTRIDFVDPTWVETAERPFDPHLTEAGFKQARALGLRLAGEGVERIFASPFLRTMQTAEKVAEVVGAPICVEHGAAEWLNHEWFRRPPDFPTPEEMAVRFPHVDTGYRSRVEPNFPETWPEHVERGEDAIWTLVHEFEQPFLIVGHAASVIAMARGLVGDRRLEVGTGVCSLTKFARDGAGWRLLLNGDTSHLRGIEGEPPPR
jgi:broad specificity phosphatase PhoE